MLASYPCWRSVSVWSSILLLLCTEDGISQKSFYNNLIARAIIIYIATASFINIYIYIHFFYLSKWQILIIYFKLHIYLLLLKFCSTQLYLCFPFFFLTIKFNLKSFHFVVFRLRRRHFRWNVFSRLKWLAEFAFSFVILDYQAWQNKQALWPWWLTIKRACVAKIVNSLRILLQTPFKSQTFNRGDQQKS